MKEDIKQKWIKALRSRKYRKGNAHWLHTKKNYASYWSTLGVLTNLWMQEQGGCWSYVKDDRYEDVEQEVGLSNTKRVSIDREAHGLLNPQVVRWAGVLDEYVTLPSLANLRKNQRKKLLEQGGSIASLGDLSFRDVADIVESIF